MNDQSWKSAWDPVVRNIGLDIFAGADAEAAGADTVDASAIRRWCEPLEFACALHEDRATAIELGFADVTAPYTAVATFALAPVWEPGQAAVFTQTGRDAQPARSPVSAAELSGAPATSGFFATEVENEYLRPLVVGDRVRRARRRLTACVPKETRVGRGAFVTFESELVDQDDELVAINRSTYFYYCLPAEETDVDDR